MRSCVRLSCDPHRGRVALARYPGCRRVGRDTRSDTAAKARILAARLDHQPLKRWVTSELDGYEADDDLPDYRRLRDLEVKADFSGPSNSGLRNATVPPACIDEAHHELFSADNRQGIAALQDLVVPTGSLPAPWPANAVVCYADCVYESMSMMNAHKVIPRGAVVGIVDGVRNRLLSFALELSKLLLRSATQPEVPQTRHHRG